MKKRRLFEVRYQFGQVWLGEFVWAQSRRGAACRIYRRLYKKGYRNKIRRSHLVFYPARFHLKGKWTGAFLRDCDYDPYL